MKRMILSMTAVWPGSRFDGGDEIKDGKKKLWKKGNNCVFGSLSQEEGAREYKQLFWLLVMMLGKSTCTMLSFLLGRS